jgi:hypothetical protein
MQMKESPSHFASPINFNPINKSHYQMLSNGTGFVPLSNFKEKAPNLKNILASSGFDGQVMTSNANN